MRPIRPCVISVVSVLQTILDRIIGVQLQKSLKEESLREDNQRRNILQH